MTTPDLGAGWFSYLIQGGSFAALILFMYRKNTQDEAREKSLGDTVKAILADSQKNRETFEAELVRYRLERDSRENALITRLDLKDQQMIDFLTKMHVQAMPHVVKP